MNQLYKVQEVLLWAMCGSLLPLYSLVGGYGLGSWLALFSWLVYALRLGAQLVKSVHEQMVDAQIELDKEKIYSIPPKVHYFSNGDITVHAYPLIQWLSYCQLSAFDNMIIEIEGKHYRIKHIYLNTATPAALLNELDGDPAAIEDLRRRQF